MKGIMEEAALRRALKLPRDSLPQPPHLQSPDMLQQAAFNPQMRVSGWTRPGWSACDVDLARLRDFSLRFYVLCRPPQTDDLSTNIKNTYPIGMSEGSLVDWGVAWLSGDGMQTTVAACGAQTQPCVCVCGHPQTRVPRLYLLLLNAKSEYGKRNCAAHTNSQ